MNKILHPSVRKIVDLLVKKKYKELESLTQGVRLSAEEISRAVDEYGRTLVSIPEDAFSLVSVIEVKNSAHPRWSVTVPLWTTEEGRSDLSVELTITQRGAEFLIELDDIRVL